MKSLLFIFLLVGLFSFGQRRLSGDPFNDVLIFEQFRIEDSIEGLYTDERLLSFVTDTLPIYSGGDDGIWRKLKIIYYYFDSMNVLKRIAFRDGQDGYYYFYFEHNSLTKARSIKTGLEQILVHHYSNAERNYSISEIYEKLFKEPERNNFYETLILGRTFLERYTTHL